MTGVNQDQTTRIGKLKRALDEGHIDQDTYAAAVAGLNARLDGSGAIAQGPDALALGEKATYVAGHNNATINYGVIIEQGKRLGASRADLQRAYLARILIQANQLPLFAGEGASAQVRLSAVYTALLTQRSEGEPGSRQQTAAIGSARDGDARKLSALEVLSAEKKLVLLGGPGSGKSTFVNFVALSMAGEMLGAANPNLATLCAALPGNDGDSEDRQVQHWEHGALLPVQIVLRDLASEMPPPGTAVNAGTLWNYISGRLKQAALEEFAPWLREELLDRGGLILLDGLDEVPDARQRRQQIKDAVQDFAASFSRCRFLVTSRTYAYQREDWKLDDFVEVHLLPFAPVQIQGFVDAWYAHMVELARLSESDARGRAELLKSTIERNERLAELATRPLLLTLIARLHTEQGGTLPEKREELYARAVDLLLNQWENLKVHFRPDGTKEIAPSLAEWLNAGRDDIRRELDKLAFEAHRDQAELVGTAEIREDRLLAALFAAAPGNPDLKPRLLVEHLRDRAGLLAAHGDGLYQFPHRTFQEYLAACHLTVDRFPDELSRLAQADPNRWREAVLLAAAKVARGTPEAVWSLADALSPLGEPPVQGQPSAAALWGALLAGQALWETGLAEPGPNTAPRNEAKRQRVQRWLRAIVERGWLPPVDRALAGRVLSVVGDDRDFDELVTIPAGEFWMGDDEMSKAKPRHRVRLPAFRIGKYPVTNVQFRRFVRATQRPWTSTDAHKPERRNHPASYVTWHDALAYCEWLTGEWRGSGKIGALATMTLPSEAEWERAARGTDGRSFPWADAWREDCANTSETGIADTSAVGIFPQGASAAGCLDIAGNVREWTRSLWGSDFMKPEFTYPYLSDVGKCEDLNASDDMLRLVRSGSWHSVRVGTHCAIRHRYPPGYRLDYLGFRVVLRSPPVS